MQTNSNFSFQVSLSTQAFSDKTISAAMIGTTRDKENRRIRKEYGFPSGRGIGFQRTSVTSESLLNSLLEGKVFCHLFNPFKRRKDGTFSSSEKKNDNFSGSYVIGVDIDHTEYESAESFVSKLSLQPTFFYSSYSNMQLNEDGSSKGARFRLIYVFSEKIENPYFFRYCAWNLNRHIEVDTGELITDDCNLRASQYFNGTCRYNENVVLSYGLTNAVYDFNDISVTNGGYVDFLRGYCGYKTRTKERTEDILGLLQKVTQKEYIYDKGSKEFKEVNPIKVSFPHFDLTCIYCTTNKTSSINVKTETEHRFEESIYSQSINTILNDWDRLDIDEFQKCSEWEKARRTTPYVYRVQHGEWINDLYQYVDEKYFSMFYYQSALQDGQKRRKSLYQRMCLRRLIKPTITADELVVNTLLDIMRFCDNSDRVLNSDYIKRNVESALNQTLEEIEDTFKESIDYLRKTTKPKRGIIYKDRQAHSKLTTYLILDELYNDTLSVSVNLETINNIFGYRVGKTTLYEYLKDRGIKPVTGILTDEDLEAILDVNLSARKNLEILKEHGIRIGNKRVLALLKKKKA